MLTVPKVTVICTCYNHEKFVEDALDSIISQTYPNVQIIVVDDFSTDNSVKTIEHWIKKHPDTLFIKNALNLGCTKSFNNAFQYATGDYLIDFAADDILLENCIEEQINAFNTSKFENLAIVYSNINLVDENLNFISKYYDTTEHPESGNVYKMIISRSVKICSVGAMVKKGIFEAIGGYDEDLIYEDLDLWIRVSRHYNFQYISKILAKKRELSHSLGSNFFKKGKVSKEIHQSTLKILKKTLELNTSKDEYSSLLQRIRFEMVKLLWAREFSLLFRLSLIGLKAFFKSL